MADNRTYYVICADGCKFESMTKEQILSAIEQAVSKGEIKDVDTGFVTKIREKNKNAGLSFWVGTSAEYNALATINNDCFYILTDDTIGDDLKAAIETLKTDFEEYCNNVADFVVERSPNNSDYESYTKWNSGAIEYQRNGKTGFKDLTKINDNLFKLETSIGLSDYIKSVNHIHFNVCEGDFWAGKCCVVDNYIILTIFSYCEPQDRNIDVEIHIKGTWK